MGYTITWATQDSIKVIRELISLSSDNTLNPISLDKLEQFTNLLTELKNQHIQEFKPTFEYLENSLKGSNTSAENSVWVAISQLKETCDLVELELLKS